MRRSLAVAAMCLAACSPAEPPGFDQPAAALHDPIADVYLVSNVHGPALQADGNGYIARVQPDGDMRRYWLAGGRDGVTLHAPRGMALAGDVLWVADLDHLRRFDRATGKVLPAVVVPGATCLWGVAIAPDGTVYASDAGGDGVGAGSGTDAIWRLAPDGALTALIRGAELGQPRGLVATASGVYCVGWRDGTFFQVDQAGRRTDLAKAPTTQLDGLVRGAAGTAADGSALAPAWFATSHAGQCVYRFDATGGVQALPRTVVAPTGLGFDAVRRRLLLPLASSGELQLLQL